jgi:two-component system nitrogen regulation sensor histidine kinase NtrY
MLTTTLKLLKNYSLNNKRILILIVLAVILSLATYYEITEQTKLLVPDPSRVIGLVLLDLIIFLTLGIILARKLFQSNSDKNDIDKSSRLQNRIIIAFSLVAAIPTIIVAVFSAYFFNFGIQSWFDKKLSTVLEQSIIVGESYVAEHTLQLKETAISVADDLSEMYYDLIQDPALFNKTLSGEAEMRSLSEAIVFQKNTNTILAQTRLSFSLSFATISLQSLEKADRGEPVEIKSDPTKIRVLVKLKEYNDTYLLIGRLIDNKIIDHIDKTNGAAAEYHRLKNRISTMQIQFSVIFILVALLLLLAAISWGAIFASQIVRPIRKLVRATEKVKDGDLSVQISEENLNKDEIKVLTSAFNRMTQQLNLQQKDLLVAQRALAWSDVARRVAHEIKNPLTPIQLAAERLYTKFEDEIDDKAALRKYTDTIIRHTGEIKRIVSEFVNFARLPLPVFNVCEVVSLVRVIEDSRKLLNDKIIYTLTSNLEKIDFICDSSQVSQVMLNLIKNSEEALEGHDAGKIDIYIVQLNNVLTIQVNDNGPGFSSDLIGRAAEAYVTTRLKGTGLGLAIVKKIVQDHLGEMAILNNKPKGASIKLTFNMNELESKLK